VIAKVTFGGELFLRSEKEKVGYKGPLFAALPGDLIISKIRVGQGSFCIIGDDLDQVAVSPEYPVYTLDTQRIDPGYLVLVLRAQEFLIQLVGSASGNTTKRRIRPSFFESLRIPLPPLSKQQAIVASYHATLGRAEELEREADEIETKATAAFETALGFDPPKPLPDHPVFVASFNDLDRWSHEGILRRMVEGNVLRASPYPMVQLRDVIADLENGWSPKCYNRPAEDGEWGVLKLGAVSFGTFDQRQNKALPDHFQSRRDLEVKTGQVLISRANITRLVGAVALVGATRGKLMLCDKIFRVVLFDSSPIDSAFLTEVMRIRDVRRQIETNVTGTSPTMKNISKPALMSLRFPLPPIGEQTTLTETLATARTMAADLRKQAKAARSTAWTDFEDAVYAGSRDAAARVHSERNVNRV